MLRKSRDEKFLQEISKTPMHGIKLNQKLTFGKYFLSITAVSGKNKILLKKSFYVRWGKHTVFLPNLKEAVETPYLTSGEPTKYEIWYYRRLSSCFCGIARAILNKIKKPAFHRRA